MRTPGPLRSLPLLLALGGAAAAPAAAACQQDSLTVTPGAGYAAAGALHEALLGRHYRSLWTTPLRAPVLDLSTFAGGLSPVETGGNKQTRSLRFRGADGREYNFRSLDKEVTPGLPPFLQETLIDWVMQDLTSAQLPTAPIVATALLDAAGVLNPGPGLAVLPDDPALGPFRAEFAGMLGTLEVHANEGEEGAPLFAGSPLVVGTERMLEYLEESPLHRVDSEAFLRAKLLDALLGDFDRHAGQWRWARVDRDGIHWWAPVPEDRDYAFVDYDGLGLAIARRAVAPRLVRFQDRYPRLLALMDNSLELNRRLLSASSRGDWDAAAIELQERLPGPVIEAAVRRMPAAHYAIQGEELTRRLIARRDGLRAMAADYHRLLARSAEVHATDEADLAELVREADGSLVVRLHAAGADQGDAPYYSRRFHPEETEEVRLFLHGGDDRAVVSGEGGQIRARVIGGGGDDLLEDLAAGPTTFYDARGENRFRTGPATRVNREEYHPPAEVGSVIPSAKRDWGESFSRLSPAVDWKPHAELVVGGGPTWTRFAFRHDPFAWRLAARGLYAPLHGRAAVEVRGDFRREGSPSSLSVLGRVSGLEATAFHGLGNRTPRRQGDDAPVWHQEGLLQAGLRVPLSPGSEIQVEGVARHTDPGGGPGALLAGALPYGADPVGQLGVRAAAQLRSRTEGEPLGPGATLEVEGAAYPAVWDLATPYARASARGAVAREIPATGGVVVAGRVGGSAVLGDFPFFDAAFLGGWDSLRGFRHQRLAGDAAAYGGAELRIPVAPLELLVRGRLGASLFADAGRVFVDGASPGGWHTAAGGSLWFSTPVGALVLGYARGEESRLYLRLDTGR